ncbi:ATP-binding protein [Oscillatoria sp. FACHB-1406]|uniref:ATP-binding protein n=1 Tax=Oscillatoria sp. FACHB-1406 TaxID=2692846 RepID=UPI0016833058|nr:ATP-binding protein [Oscillatoria sp. FACHB-1406]MBD2578836.1 ATP-binding protein [Oscillatoria sp. FACHB-1406]
MADIDQIICREINPFDIESLKPGNFWQEQQDKALTVDSIHQNAITEIEELLDRVAADNRSRTVLLLGDPGSGKSYLLGRMKRVFNPKAFFAYIGPWPNSDRIWQHVLRYTVDSLMHTPEGQTESQLMLWLKSLSVFRKLSMKEVFFEESVWNLLRSNRQKFIKQFRDTYRNKGIYNAENFFGVLHDLTDPNLSDIACDWLRGEDLSEESLAVLKVKQSILTEEAACETLYNLGRIATETQPIVLCFDQLDGIPPSPNGLLDLQALFNVNTNIHNQKLESLLIIISITTDTWNKNSKQVHLSDLDRIDKQVRLKQITTEQIEALWSMRLHSLHQQAQPRPASSIYPLDKQQIKINFPGGRAIPRAALVVGRDLFKTHKQGLIINPIIEPSGEDEILPAFNLAWQNEYKKVRQKISKIVFLSAPELIQRLKSTLVGLQVKIEAEKLLSGSYSSYSFSFLHLQTKQIMGVVWTEDANMRSFYNIMKACQKVLDDKQVIKLYLIRASDVSNPNLSGTKLYQKIFKTASHQHLRETLTSVHYLETYHSLLNAVKAHELVVAGKTINLEELNSLVRQAGVLEQCQLLQDLKLFSGTTPHPVKPDPDNLKEVKNFLLNRLQTQGFTSLKTLIENVSSHFESVDRTQIEEQVNCLVQEQKIKISNPKDAPEKQLVFWIPASQKHPIARSQ